MTMNIPLDYYRTFYYVAKYGKQAGTESVMPADDPL